MITVFIMVDQLQSKQQSVPLFMSAGSMDTVDHAVETLLNSVGLGVDCNEITNG